MQSAQQRLSLDLDAYFRDPEYVDPKLPPHFMQFSIDSGGTNVPVKMWLAGGAGAKGTVIISPPMGGSDSMNSVAIPLMNAGIHVLSYRPRGIRDPKVAYSQMKQMEDIHAMINWVVANAGANKTAPFGPPLRSDPERIALFEMSEGGGNLSYAVCAESKHANFAIAVATGNIEWALRPDNLEKLRPMFNRIKETTRGRHDYEAWMLAMTPEEVKSTSLINIAPKLVSEHLLLLGGHNDMTAPIAMHHNLIAKALQDAGVKDFTSRVLETDHGFTTKRYALPRVMIAWLHQRGF